MNKHTQFGPTTLEKRWAVSDLGSPAHIWEARVARIERLSQELATFPVTTFNRQADTLTMVQQRVSRKPWNPVPVAKKVLALQRLAMDLDLAAAAEFVHGDICLKNVIWDGCVLWLVDLEPDLLQYRNQALTWRVTIPWIAHADLSANEITTLTDRIGFAALCMRSMYGLPESLQYSQLYARRKQADVALPWNICDREMRSKSFQAIVEWCGSQPPSFHR